MQQHAQCSVPLEREREREREMAGRQNSQKQHYYMQTLTHDATMEAGVGF